MNEMPREWQVRKAEEKIREILEEEAEEKKPLTHFLLDYLEIVLDCRGLVLGSRALNSELLEERMEAQERLAPLFDVSRIELVALARALSRLTPTQEEVSRRRHLLCERRKQLGEKQQKEEEARAA